MASPRLPEGFGKIPLPLERKEPDDDEDDDGGDVFYHPA